MQPHTLDDLSAEQLREMTTRLLAELRHSQPLNAKLTHENALLTRLASRIKELLPHRWQAPNS